MDDNSWGDEFEVEVTDLRTGHRAHVQPPDAAGRALPVQPRAVPLDDGLSPAPVEISRPPSAGRRRGIVAGSAITLLALVVLLVPGSPLSINHVAVRKAAPTVTIAVSSSETMFYTVHSVPWGKLTVDGAEVTPIDNGSGVANITLPPGAHAIEYSAPPFPAIRCKVTVPNQGKDTCPMDPTPTDVPNLPDPSARVLDLRATVANLPAGEQATLTAKVNAGLKAFGGRAQLQAGDHYLDASGNTQVAATNMLAIDSYGLAANFQQRAGCGAICDEPGMAAGPNGPAWVVVASLVENWRYLSANGPATSGPQLGENGAPLQRAFGVTWNGDWQVSSMENYGSLVCEIGNNALAQDLQSVNSNVFQNTQTGSSPNSPADGCILSVAPTDSSGTATGPAAYFLYRCGAFIAINPPAQAMLPGAPSASAHEQQLATQMIANIGA